MPRRTKLCLNDGMQRPCIQKLNLDQGLPACENNYPRKISLASVVSFASQVFDNFRVSGGKPSLFYLLHLDPRLLIVSKNLPRVSGPFVFAFAKRVWSRRATTMERVLRLAVLKLTIRSLLHYHWTLTSRKEIVKSIEEVAR